MDVISIVFQGKVSAEALEGLLHTLVACGMSQPQGLQKLSRCGGQEDATIP